MQGGVRTIIEMVRDFVLKKCVDFKKNYESGEGISMESAIVKRVLD